MINTLRNIEWTDARLIRLSIVLFFGLVLFVYLARGTDLLNASRTFQLKLPQYQVVSAQESIAPATDDTVIFGGELVARELSTGGIQKWTFEAGGGEVIDINVSPVGVYDEGFDPVVELFDPQGQPIMQINDAPAGQPELIRGVSLPIAGEYTIWISDSTFSFGGNYNLNYVPYRVKATHPLRLGVGELLRDSLQLGEYDYWVFSGDEGQSMSFTLMKIREFEDDFAPVGQIYGPDGMLLADLAAPSAESPSTILNFTLPRTGTYTFWVTEDGYDNTGEYAISVQLNGGKDEIPIPLRSTEN